MSLVYHVSLDLFRVASDFHGKFNPPILMARFQGGNGEPGHIARGLV